MPVLVIHQGAKDLHLEPSQDKTYAYRIGAGRIVGRLCQDLNDAVELNQISEELRDKYASWIYKFNKEFLEAGLVWENTSLFFLSDISVKRAELFDTYNTLSVLTQIKRGLKSVEIETVLLYGVDKAFVQAVESMFPDATVRQRSSRSQKASLSRRGLADLWFLLNLLVVSLLNKFLPPQGTPTSEKSTKYFFSFFPQTFDEKNEDLRYGQNVKAGDRYLVTLMADGMHQQLNSITYWKNQRKANGEKFVVIDRGLRVTDIFLGIKTWLRMVHFVYTRDCSSDFIFGLDISRYIFQELIWSVSRVARLIIFARALERVLRGLNISELTYVVFEYPLGRAISAVVGTKFPEIKRIGFNHGEFSWRFLNYFLANEEPSVLPPYLEHCPIPDQVLAEDQLTKEIYEFNGYMNVDQMQNVRRLNYLKKVKRVDISSKTLIVAGLHDGEDLWHAMISKVTENPLHTYYFRPHPRGDNRYLKASRDAPNNLVIDLRPLHEVLSSIESVYVTYSGLGYELAGIGIPISVVCVPGRLNWSKCLDKRSDTLRIGLCQI